MKNPVLYTLIVYISGIISAYILDFSIIVFLNIFIILLTIIKQISSKHLSGSLILLCASFITGSALCYISCNDVFSPLNNYKGEYVTITGRMCETPQYDPSRNISSFTVLTDTLEYKGDYFAVSDKIRVSTTGEYAYGLTVKVSGFLSEFDERMNSSGYNGRLQNKINGISYKIFAENDDFHIVKANKLPRSLYDAYNMLKFNILKIIDLYFSDNNAGLLHIILFGDYRNINSSLKHKLSVSGAIRFLHSPYLFIFIAASLADLISLNLSITKKYRVIISCAAVIALIIINHGSSSFIRSGIFFAVFLLYTRRYGYLHFPDAASAAIFIILLINPLLLFNGNFVLSVYSCVMLYLFKNHTMRFLEKFISHRHLRRTVSTWLICTTTLIPLSAYYYNNLSLYTLIYSLIFPPLIFTVLFFMPAVILLLSLIRTAPVFYQIVIASLFIIRKTTDLICLIPYNNIILSAPSVTAVTAFVIAVYLFYMKLENENNSALYTILTAFFVVFTLMEIFRFCSSYGSVNIHFINVGQGDSALIDVVGKETILIDGGGSEVYSDYKVGEQIVVPYIRSKCGGRIDTVIVSHYHKDHCDGIIDVLTAFDVKRIIMPDCEEDNELRLLLENTAASTGCDVIYASQGLCMDYPSGLKMKMLLPDNELMNSDDLNNTSLVTLLSYGNFDALFMGDTTADGEKKLLSLGEIKDIDLLKAGHHGSATSSDESFIEYTSPLVSIISCGRNNRYNFPDDKVAQRLETGSEMVLRTDKNGDIIVSADKNGLKKINIFTGA
ncbi:MAG: ComEC/Rec2 family competence protein [Oscillospiraceae bacterium]|nr:ComEC/Rec2 family competence protein [Oscillospiraceae bacterium]